MKKVILGLVCYGLLVGAMVAISVTNETTFGSDRLIYEGVIAKARFVEMNALCFVVWEITFEDGIKGVAFTRDRWIVKVGEYARLYNHHNKGPYLEYGRRL